LRLKICQLLCFIILMGGVNNGPVIAANNQPRPLEEIYPEIGYTKVEEAVSKFEQHFKKDVKLPVRLPPITFTHHFGRFNNLEGDVNDSLEVVFLNKDFPGHHFKIDIRPVSHKIPMGVNDTFKLHNGSIAKYTNVANFNLLVFDRDGWQYILSVDKKASGQVTEEVLVEIANSIGGVK
jgi:hypothetical protein